MQGTLAVVVVSLLLLAATSSVAWYVWTELGDVAIGMHGLIALGLGAGATLLLGMGLMSLVYFSHKRGFDDAAGHD